MVHSSAMEIRPDGCDNQPFGKLHTHYILENRCTYVWMCSYAGLFLWHPNGWDFSEAVPEKVNLRIPFRAKAWLAVSHFPKRG